MKQEFSPSGGKGPTPPLLTFTALGLASALAIFGLFFPQQFLSLANSLNDAFLHIWSDTVLAVSSLLLLACFVIALSPIGKIRLGLPGDRPEFSTPAWATMLFAAGMGAGLLYWGVTEPITHFSFPPVYSGDMAAAGPARMAMVISYFHWALHPWGIYAAGALCIAYFSFCRGFAILPGSAFRAVMPRRFRLGHLIGDAVDVACVMALLLGMAAAMAAGTMQIASGTHWLGNTAQQGHRATTYVLIVLPMTLVYLISAATPIDKGIKQLSILNMLLACLLGVIACFGESLGHITKTLVQSVADYLRFLPSLSFFPLGGDETPRWSETWTANYFLSWIAWVPFVGIFVARISRGRTIREFLLGAIFIPSLFTFLWFAVFGGIAIGLQESGAIDLAAAVKIDSGQALFSLMSLHDHKEILWMLIIAVVFIFLVTGADSASYVLAIMAARGAFDPPVSSRLFWGSAIAALTCATLFSENGIHSVRALFSFSGIAVFFILIGQMLCLLWGLLGHGRAKKDAEFE